MDNMEQAIRAYASEMLSYRAVAKKFAVSEKKLRLCIKERNLGRTIRNYAACRKMSEETKRKISEIRKQFLKENPDKVPYLLNHSRKESYPEMYFREWLSKNDIAFEQEYKVGIYSLDFLIGNIDLEIDGSQHTYDIKVVESDKRRADFLESNGYKIVRVDWKNYCKLDSEERALYLLSLKTYLTCEQREKPVLINKKRELAMQRELRKTDSSLRLRINKRKFSPSKDELYAKWSELKFNNKATGRFYGVSDNAVKKRLKQFGLEGSSLKQRETNDLAVASPPKQHLSKEEIEAVLFAKAGNISQAANALNVGRGYLRSRIKLYNISNIYKEREKP